MKWFFTALRKYAVFSGRARRIEYWIFILVFGMIYMVEYVSRLEILNVLLLLLVVPAFAVTARRLHDTGRSAWCYFIFLVPLIGPIILFVFLAQPGTIGQNQYGVDPKATN